MFASIVYKQHSTSIMRVFFCREAIGYVGLELVTVPTKSNPTDYCFISCDMNVTVYFRVVRRNN